MSAQDDPGHKRKPDEPPSRVLKIRNNRNQVEFISITDVLLAEWHGHYAKIYYLDEGKVLDALHQNTMPGLLKKLPPPIFRKLNRSYIIHEQRLKRFDGDKHCFITETNYHITLQRALSSRKV